jgi:hypothetical protein
MVFVLVVFILWNFYQHLMKLMSVQFGTLFYFVL